MLELVWPWWWSSGHRANIILQQSKFKLVLNPTVFMQKLRFEKNENKQKGFVLAHFLKS